MLPRFMGRTQEPSLGSRTCTELQQAGDSCVTHTRGDQDMFQMGSWSAMLWQLQGQTKQTASGVKGCLQSPRAVPTEAKAIWAKIIAAELAQGKPRWKQHNPGNQRFVHFCSRSCICTYCSCIFILTISL